MPVRVGRAAAARIALLKRYRTYLMHTAARGFFVRVVRGTRSRPHRVLHVTKGAAAAAAAMGDRLVQVFLRDGKLAARVIRRPPATLGEKALKLAAMQIGVVEKPINEVIYNTWYYGHEVNGPAYPWCAVFVSWVLSHVGRPFHEAYVPTIVTRARNHEQGLTVIPYQDVAVTLAAGHPVLACYDWPNESPGTADHIEFVEKVISGSTFQAIGGNTAAPGGNQSNGGQVCRNTRYTTDVLCFVKVA